LSPPNTNIQTISCK